MIMIFTMLPGYLSFIIVFYIGVFTHAIPFPPAAEYEVENNQDDIDYTLGDQEQNFQESIESLRQQQRKPEDYADYNSPNFVNIESNSNIQKNPKLSENNKVNNDFIKNEKYDHDYYDNNLTLSPSAIYPDLNQLKKLEGKRKKTEGKKEDEKIIDETCINHSKPNQQYTGNLNSNISSLFEDDLRISGKPTLKRKIKNYMGEDVTVCWVETITIKEDKTIIGSPNRQIFREFSISFENSVGIPEENLNCPRRESEEIPVNSKEVCNTSFSEAISQNTRKSKVVKLQNTSRQGNIWITEHKKVRCGVGSFVTKDILTVIDDPRNLIKKVEITVSPLTSKVHDYCNTLDGISNDSLVLDETTPCLDDKCLPENLNSITKRPLNESQESDSDEVLATGFTKNSLTTTTTTTTPKNSLVLNPHNKDKEVDKLNVTLTEDDSGQSNPCNPEEYYEDGKCFNSTEIPMSSSCENSTELYNSTVPDSSNEHTSQSSEEDYLHKQITFATLEEYGNSSSEGSTENSKEINRDSSINATTTEIPGVPSIRKPKKPVISGDIKSPEISEAGSIDPASNNSIDVYQNSSVSTEKPDLSIKKPKVPIKTGDISEDENSGVLSEQGKVSNEENSTTTENTTLGFYLRKSKKPIHSSESSNEDSIESPSGHEIILVPGYVNTLNPPLRDLYNISTSPKNHIVSINNENLLTNQSIVENLVKDKDVVLKNDTLNNNKSNTVGNVSEECVNSMENTTSTEAVTCSTDVSNCTIINLPSSFDEGLNSSEEPSSSLSHLEDISESDDTLMRPNKAQENDTMFGPSTRPTPVDAETKLTQISNINETQEAVVAVDVANELTKINGRHKLALKIKVSLEHVGDDREQHKIADIEKNLTLDENPNNHGNNILLQHLQSLNNTENNFDSIKQLFNCSILDKISDNIITDQNGHQDGHRHIKHSTTEMIGDDGGPRRHETRERRSLGSTVDAEKNSFAKKNQKIKACLSEIHEDIKTGLDSILSEFSSSYDTENSTPHTNPSKNVKLSRIKSHLNNVEKNDRNKRSVNIDNVKELSRWSNERFINLVGGDKLRSITELILFDNFEDS